MSAHVSPNRCQFSECNRFRTVQCNLSLRNGTRSNLVTVFYTCGPHAEALAQDIQKTDTLIMDRINNSQG